MSNRSFLTLDQWLIHNQVEAVVCLLPENIFYLTNTLPVLGISAVCYLPGKKPILLHPESEVQWADTSSCELVAYPVGRLGNSDFLSVTAQWLQGLAVHLGIHSRNIGVELSFSASAPPFSSAETNCPDINWYNTIRNAFKSSTLVDVTPGLTEVRGIKDIAALEQLKKVNRIAQFGLTALQNSIRPGLREAEAAALVEQEIRSQGTGFQGARLVKAYAQVTSGVEGTIQQYMLTPSGLRKLQTGDLVMIELAVCADGYWSDLTRVYCVGVPNEQQKKVFNAVYQAQAAAAACLVPDNTWESADSAARTVLEAAGLGKFFIHGTGHGVGYRYHEPIPQLGPGKRFSFKGGMVTSVEPGVYIPGFGGIRIEDNLAVTADGPVWLSEPCLEW